MRHLTFRTIIALAFALPAAAQTPPMPEQVVVTASALPGTAIDPDKIPVNIQTLSSTDLTRFGTASTLGTLVNEIAGVSFGRWQSTIQYGVATGSHSLYIAGNAVTEEGWRAHSLTRLAWIFADAGWRDADSEVHLNLVGALTKIRAAFRPRPHSLSSPASAFTCEHRLTDRP